jgi:uncharacterized phage-associated protein
MATLNNVSDYIVMKMSEGRTPLNVLKLHKLVYYVQAWHLAFTGNRLFNGNFQAWVHGPVNRALYDRYPDKTMYSTVAITDIAAGFSPATLTAEERAHIDSVLEVYGDLAGYQLEEMTHNEAPWIDVRNGLPSTARSENVISDTTMRDYYRARLPQN